MKRSWSLALALVLGLVLVVFANSEDGYSFTYQCSDASNDYYSFTSIDSESLWAFVPQDGTGQVLYLDGVQSETLIAFPHPSKGVLVYLGMNQVEIVYASYGACGVNPTTEFEASLTRDLQEAMTWFHQEAGR
jgi:hypothetical protein